MKRTYGLTEAGEELIKTHPSRVRVVGVNSTIGSQVFLDGAEIPAVQDISWQHVAGQKPTVTVTIQLPTLDAAAGDVVFHGLEKVPSAALKQELFRREESP